MTHHIVKRCVSNIAPREKNDIITRKRAAHHMANAPHSPLSSVTPYGVSQAFSGNKSNTTTKVVLFPVP